MTAPADWYTRDPAYVPRSAIPAHVEGETADVLDDLRKRLAHAQLMRHGWRVMAAHIAGAASALGPAVYRAEDTTGGDGG